MPQSFGLISAAPHQFLIRLRGGEVVTARQGGSCFKWPGDTVALVDTSVHRLQFTADQITRERAGVKVTGLAVFRVVEPLLAYRMLNLDDPDALHGILREMFVGATRRLVANLDLEDCLTRRKEALATELMGEVAPVVSGHGRTQDGADRGWGVAIDTIEVQDVRVLSEEVFTRMQAPFREALELKALRARAEVATEKARLAEESARAQERRRRQHMELEEARLEAERDRAQRQAEHEAEMRRAALQARLAMAATEAEAAAAREEASLLKQLEMEERRAASEVAQAEQRAQARTLERGAELALMAREREAQMQVSEGRLRELALTQTLPEVARAFRGSFDKVVVTGASDMGFVGQGMSQALASLEAFGVRLPRAPAEGA